VRREVLYNILIEFGIPMKLVRLLGPLGPQRELEVPGYGVMVPASKEERKGTQ
jgi:hypothetical protein